jgi:hypothetical protein
MNVEKIDSNVYYYTDLVSQEDKDYVLLTIKNYKDWLRIYDDGHEYDPKSDRSKPRSVMLASRSNFKDINDNNKLINIINRAYQSATNHYREDKNIIDGNDYPIYVKGRLHVDRHEVGTTYMSHIDTAPINTECYTVLLYLNDDYVGGEISFNLPKKDEKLSDGPNGFFPPDSLENKGLIDFWIKPEAMSIVIFPPLHPYPHVAHEVTFSEKYLIKGFWVVGKK